MSAAEKEKLRAPTIQKLNRYKYQINGCAVDFSPVVPIQPSDKNIPIWLAKYLGLLKIAFHHALPAIFESLKS
jgi:hypothetical protein